MQQCLLNAHCLQQLSKQDIVLLAKHAKIQNYPRNSIVFRQGAPCVGVAVVLTVDDSSTCSLQKRSDNPEHSL